MDIPVSPLKSQFPAPSPFVHCRSMYQTGECSEVPTTIYAGLSLSPASSQLLHSPLNLQSILFIPVDLASEGSLWYLFTALSPGVYPFLLLSLFCLVMWSFLQLQLCVRSAGVLAGILENCSRVDVFLMYLWEEVSFMLIHHFYLSPYTNFYFINFFFFTVFSSSDFALECSGSLHTNLTNFASYLHSGKAQWKHSNPVHIDILLVPATKISSVFWHEMVTE